MPTLLLGFLKCGAQRIGRSSRVEDQDIESTENFPNRCRQPLDIRPLQHVSGHCHDLDMMLLPDLFSDRLQFVGRPREQNHVDTFGGQRIRYIPAHAGTGCRDERDLVVDT